MLAGVLFGGRERESGAFLSEKRWLGQSEKFEAKKSDPGQRQNKSKCKDCLWPKAL
jgi:hypothetical protein